MSVYCHPSFLIMFSSSRGFIFLPPLYALIITRVARIVKELLCRYREVFYMDKKKIRQKEQPKPPPKIKYEETVALLKAESGLMINEPGVNTDILSGSGTDGSL